MMLFCLRRLVRNWLFIYNPFSKNFILAVMSGLAFIMLVCYLPNWGHAVSQHKYGFQSPWTYLCHNETCVKTEYTEEMVRETLTTCKMTCGEFGPLWPRPNGQILLGNEVLPFRPSNLKIGNIAVPSKNVKELLHKSIVVFQEKLRRLFPHTSRQLDPTSETADIPTQEIGNYPKEFANNVVTLSISVSWKDVDLILTTEESYTLHIRTDKPAIEAVILAKTFFGARHGLETLFQLIDFDEVNGGLQIVTSAAITDRPAFPFRGITLDTSRNFVNIPAIRRTIDAMSYAKLNTFNWHIIDTQSFPFYSESVPQLTLYGAYSPLKVYYPDQIRELIEYGRIRGVRIIPEFDAPAHVGNGWQWGPKEGKGIMTVCVNQEPWQQYCAEPPCGQLNPTNDLMYEVLGHLYHDFFRTFDITDLFHMGGDEVHFNCWNTSSVVTDYMDEHGISRDEAGFVSLWNTFQEKAYAKVKKANGGDDLSIIIWSSDLTAMPYLTKYLSNSQYVVQIWTSGKDPQIANLVENNYRIIFSNYDALYLDCGYGAWLGTANNWCTPYKGWQLIYENSPYKLLAAYDIPNLVENAKLNGLVLGGSAAMWTEQVDEMALDGKIWPRASALAERLWADPITPWQAAEKRMYHNRERIQRLGIAADALQPEWCHQNERHCYL